MIDWIGCGPVGCSVAVAAAAVAAAIAVAVRREPRVLSHDSVGSHCSVAMVNVLVSN